MHRAPLLGACCAMFAVAAAHATPASEPENHSSSQVLSQDREARRIVRGCDPGGACTRPQELLRVFELEAFPAPGGNPWIEERTPRRTGPAAVKRATKPSELRPDLPWLDKLVLPDLPVVWTSKLIEYLLFYKDDPRGRNIMSGWLTAQGRYRDLIVWHLRKANLPEDLLYDAMIESSYDPEVVSSAGASGLWQFMPRGGKIYGLRQDRWVDERRDPLRSTIAVLDYWADLYQRFNDWHLALAAFNAGYGAVLRSITRYNTNDYYQLCDYENGLPWETCLYGPKVLAVAIVGRNRAAFGYDQLKEVPAETWDELAVPTSMTVAAIGKLVGASEDDIKRLNPQLRRDRTPPGEVGYVVRVPRNDRGKQELARRLGDLQAKGDHFDTYVIAHGERLEDVATTFGISVGKLKKLNDVERESEIDGGTALIVPKISEAQRAKNRAQAKTNLLGSGVDHQEGEALLVPVFNKDAVVAGKKRIFYRVVTGDSLTSVATALGIERRELLEWNGLADGARLHPKMVLVAFVAPDFDADKQRVSLLDEADLQIVTRGSVEHLDLAEARTGRVRTEYVATAQEKLSDIAKKYGMGSADLARINHIPSTTVLDKGQTIIVYEVNDRSRSKRAGAQWSKTPRARRGKVSSQRAKRAASAPAQATRRGEPRGTAESASPSSRDQKQQNGASAPSSGPVTLPTQVDP